MAAQQGGREMGHNGDPQRGIARPALQHGLRKKKRRRRAAVAARS